MEKKIKPHYVETNSVFKPVHYHFFSDFESSSFYVHISFDFQGFELFFDSLLTKAMANKDGNEAMLSRIERLKEATWFLDKFQGMLLLFKNRFVDFQDFFRYFSDQSDDSKLFLANENGELEFKSYPQFEKELIFTLAEYFKISKEKASILDWRSAFEFEENCSRVIKELKKNASLEMGEIINEIK
jgi:hypothetical protein